MNSSQVVLCVVLILALVIQALHPQYRLLIVTAFAGLDLSLSTIMG